jgi:hypothetical protein
MPVPAAPRRAAPPRRKKETPKPSDEPPAPSQEEETAVPEAKVPLPDSTPNLLADAENGKTDVAPDIDSKPAHSTEHSPPAVDNEPPELVKDSGLVTERSTSPALVRSGDHDDVPEDARAPPPKEDQFIPPLPEETVAAVVEEGNKEIEERSGLDQPEEDRKEPLRQVSSDEEPTKSLEATAEDEAEPDVLTAEPNVEDTEDKPEEQPEEEEATKRARITARLAKSGGFNPFGGGPPVRKASESSLPERRTSVESPSPFKPISHEERQMPTQPPARRDTESLKDEADLPTTETKEEVKDLDALKQAEGDL